MHTFVKILLFVFVTAALTSCLVRKPYYHKWAFRHHYKRHYHRGNSYGGRRLWVKPWRTY